MFEFLGRNKNKAAKAAIDRGPSTIPPTVQLGANQIDMVRMTLHGVLKLNGIPGNWISGEVIPVHIPGQGEALLLQLEIMQWHDALVLHAPAFQEAMLDGLRRFDPEANQTRYLFTWKFSPRSGCPHVHLPKPEFWQTHDRLLMEPVAAPVTQAVAVAVAVAPLAAPSKAHAPPPVAAYQDEEDDDDGFAPTHIRDDS